MRYKKSSLLALAIILLGPSFANAQESRGDLSDRTDNNSVEVLAAEPLTSIHQEISLQSLISNSTASSSNSTAAGSSGGSSKISSVPNMLSGTVHKGAKVGKFSQPLRLKTSEDRFSSDLLPGSIFPINVDTELTSKSSVVGDMVLAHLTEDLSVGSTLLAAKGALVEGHVCKVYGACRGIKANKLNHHMANSNGGIQLEFNKLIGLNGAEYEILAAPAAGSLVTKISAGEQKLVIDKHGEVGVPYHAARYAVIATAISAGSMFAGPFGMAGAPAISAVVGGLCPSYGLGRPTYPNEKHPRFKGAFMGAVRGTPGGFITSGFLVHGLDVKVSSGDMVILELKKTLSIPTAKPVMSVSASVQ